jgi:hypothetical protein
MCGSREGGLLRAEELQSHSEGFFLRMGNSVGRSKGERQAVQILPALKVR